MPRRLRLIACLAFLLALLFVVFFQVSKHQPAFAVLNSFADDPYDAIGSFATQFAIVAALVALLRAFRPYSPPLSDSASASPAQQRLVSRAAALASLAVLVTMVSDAVALVRYRAMWQTLPAGVLLAGLVVALAVVAFLVLWSAVAAAPRQASLGGRAKGRAWLGAPAVSLVSVLVLAVYPAEWAQHIGTELLTVAVGILLLFVPLWCLDRAFFGASVPPFVDTLDDLVAIWSWARGRGGLLAWLAAPVAAIARWHPMRVVYGWLDPRRHPWRPVVLLGLVMGALLFLAEMLGEGGPSAARFGLIAAIFLGCESFGVLVGYALLARPLGLFRREMAPRVGQTASVQAR